MKPNLTLALFTPAEVEKITGVTTMVQRDWRRRGILHKRGDGHSRYDIFALAEIFTLKLLSDRGVSLADAAEVATWCGRAMAYYGLMWSMDAYEGDHLRTDEARGIAGIPIADLEGPRVAELRELGHLPDRRADWLARQVYQRKFPLVIPGPIFIWWANGTEWLFCDDFEKATAKIELGDPRLAGAVIVLNLRHTGRALVERLGRAAVHVEFPDLPAQPDGKPSS